MNGRGYARVDVRPRDGPSATGVAPFAYDSGGGRGGGGGGGPGYSSIEMRAGPGGALLAGEGSGESKYGPGGPTASAPGSGGGAGATGGGDAWDVFGDMDDMDAALDFNFDDEGNVIESEEHVRRRKVVLPLAGDGGSGAGDVVAAFTTADDVAEVRAPPKLLKRIRTLAERNELYKKKLIDLHKRSKLREQLVAKMGDELERMGKQLEDAQFAGADRNLMGMFGGQNAANKRAGNSEEDARRRREDARRQLFSGVDMIGDEELDIQDITDTNWLKQLVYSFRRFMERQMPLKGDLRTIEARFGSSVSAYFGFFRWIIANNIIVATIAGLFLVKHAFVGNFAWTDTVNVFMPRIMFWSSYTSQEALDYAGVIIIASILLAWVAVRKWINEDLRSKAIGLFEKREGEHRYSKLLLNAWDHSLGGAEVMDGKFDVGEQILLLLHEDEVKLHMMKRSWKQDAVLYTRRIIGWSLSIATQAVAGGIILQLTITSADASVWIKENGGALLAPVADFMVPVAVSILNAIQPPILSALSKFEKWDSGGTQVKGLVWRLFIAKLLNMLLQVVTYALLADPYMLRAETFGVPASDWLFDVRMSTQKVFQPESFRCRADQAGAGLFQLVLAEFFVSKIIALATPYAFKLKAKVKGVPWKKAQHDVAKAIASLLFFTQLVLNSFAWSPSSAIIGVILLFLNFKFEAFVLRHYMVKPLRPWAAKDAGGFFVKFYLISLAIAFFGNALVMTNGTFPKTCSLMDARVLESYGATDPFVSSCEVHAAAEYANAEDAADRRAALRFMGGEVDHWIVNDCPQQCLDANVSATAAGCATVCEGAVAFDLTSCTRTQPGNADGKFQVANLTRYCDLACGPWTGHVSGYAAVEEFFLESGSSVLSTFYNAANEPLVLWALALALLIFACFKWNSLSIVQSMSKDVENGLNVHIETLERTVARQKKQLDVYTQTRNR